MGCRSRCATAHNSPSRHERPRQHGTAGQWQSRLPGAPAAALRARRRWALGVLIYEMVAGYPPFYHEDRVQMFKNICHVKFSFPSSFGKARGGARRIHCRQSGVRACVMLPLEAPHADLVCRQVLAQQGGR
jgi:serine/threonine protein kinase